MLIWVDGGNYITAWNTCLTRDEAKQWESNDCIWLDSNDIPALEEKRGYEVGYKYVDGEIVAEYTEIVKSDAELLSENALDTAINVEYLVCLADMGL